MMSSWSEVVTVALALPLCWGVVEVGGVALRRLRVYATAQCIRRISNMIVAIEEPDDVEIRLLRRLFPMRVVLDSVIFVSESIYGGSLNRLRLIVEVCELDYHLLRQVRRRRGSARAQSLSRLSLLTYATTVAEYAELYMEQKHRKSRFYAMATLLSAHPDRAVRYILRFDSELTLHEVAVLVQLMRRAGVSIAYTPMLISPNRNLQLIGIYLCNYFTMTDAEPHLQRLAESEDRDVAYLALQTLCSIRGDLSTRGVGVALQRLQPHQRIAFVLRAVQNCYSLQSCAHLLTPKEQRLFSQHTSSYKCRMVCN